MNFKKSIFVVAVLMSLSLAACATPVKHDTPSGKAEATIMGASKVSIKNKITDEMINRGYSVTRSDDMLISFDRSVDNPMAGMLFGSNHGRPNARISYNLVQSRGGVRVVADCVMVTNPGTGFEKITPLNDHESTRDVQAWLNDIKKRLEKR